VPTYAYISSRYIAWPQVNGQKVRGDEAGLGETVGLISRSPGPVEIKLRRGGEEIVKRVTPRVNADTGRASIGVQMAAHIEVRNRRKVLFVVLGWWRTDLTGEGSEGPALTLASFATPYRTTTTAGGHAQGQEPPGGAAVHGAGAGGHAQGGHGLA